MKRLAKHLVLFGLVAGYFIFNGGTALAYTYAQNLQWPYYDGNTTTLAGAQACLGVALVGSGNAEQTWNYLTQQVGLTAEQAAGIMGNLNQESGINPKAVEHGYGFPAEMDTMPPNVGKDGQPGYGIAQWTSPGRKAGLQALATKNGTSVSDLALQLQYLKEEATSRGDLAKLKQETTVAGATLSWHKNFEVSNDTASQIQERVHDAEGFLAQYGSGSGTGAPVTGGCAGETSYVASTSCDVKGIPYEGQYTEDQLHQIFGPPVRESKANLTTAEFLGLSLEVNKMIAPCLEAVSNELIANNVAYKPDPAKGGMFCIRDTDGQVGDRSYHIYGAACDVNPNTNNYFSNPSGHPYDPNCPIASGVVDSGSCFDMAPQFVSAMNHHGFTWGGNWHSIKDYMHFEWHGVVPK